MQLFLQQGVVFASRHFLSLIPLDFVEENGSSLLVLTDTTRNGNSVKIETSLPFRRRFNCIVLAHGCDQHPVTETTEISKLSILCFVSQLSMRNRQQTAGDVTV